MKLMTAFMMRIIIYHLSPTGNAYAQKFIAPQLRVNTSVISYIAGILKFHQNLAGNLTFKIALSGPVCSIEVTFGRLRMLTGTLVSKWYSITSQASQKRGRSSNRTNWFPTPSALSIASLKQVCSV